MKKRNLIKYFLIGSFISFLNDFYIIKSSYSFTPSLYEPNIQELRSIGETIAKTAAQLLYFNEIKRANQLTNLAIKLNPKDDRIWALLAEIQMRNQDFKSSRESLHQAQSINPNRANYYFKEAAIDFETGKINDSIILIEKGLSLDPKNPNGYFQLGNAKIIKKEFRNALSAFERANEIEPKFWQSLNNQALVLYELNEAKKAILIWEKVLEIESDAEPMLAIAAAKYLKDMSNNKSIELAKTALLKNPKYVTEKHQKEQLWGKKLRIAAKKLLKDEKLEAAVKEAIANSTLKNGL